MSRPKPSTKNPGWFSWRHESSQAHRAAIARREQRVAKWNATMDVNRRTRETRSPQQQLALLDKEGQRAKKERARLHLQIKGQKSK